MLDDTRAIISQLDAEISGLSRPPAELRARRNAHTPLCQLAPEILGRILFWAQVRTEGTHIVHAPWADFDASWTRWMLVCRHVREAAVNTPVLWRTLFLLKAREQTALRWWILCVARAKNCPLEFVVDHNNNREQLVGPREAFLRAHWHRARKMDLDYRSPLQEGVRHLPEEKFLQLQYLRIRTYQNDVTTQFLGGCSTSLTRLELETIGTVIKGVPYLPALRTLKFTTNDVAYSHKDPRHLAMLFAAVPALEALSVHVLASLDPNFASDNALRGAPPFTLVHLRTLELLGPRHGLAGLLRMLPRPRSALSITETWRVDDDDPKSFLYLQEFWKIAAPQEPLPSARMGADVQPGAVHTGTVQSTVIHFALGTPFAFDTDAVEPRVFFRCAYRPAYEHALPINHVDAIHLIAEYDYFDWGSLAGIRRQIREVTVRETSFNATSYAISRLQLWLSPAQQVGHQLEVLRFIELPERKFSTTWRLALDRMQKAGMVQTVLYEVASES
jgi:hypothetical protein